MVTTISVTPEVLKLGDIDRPTICLPMTDSFKTIITLQQGQSLEIKVCAHYSQNILLQFVHSIAFEAIFEQSGQFNGSADDY